MNLLHQGFQSWRLIDFLVVSFPPSVTILFSYWKRLVTYDFIFLAQYFKFWHIDYAFACALLHCLGGKSTFFSDKWGSFFFKLWLNLSSRLAIDRFFLSVGNFFLPKIMSVPNSLSCILVTGKVPLDVVVVSVGIFSDSYSFDLLNVTKFCVICLIALEVSSWS